MKLLKTFFLLFSLAIVNNSYAQNEPDYRTTFGYIKKIFDETTGYEYIKGDAKYRIISSEHKNCYNHSKEFTSESLRFSQVDETDKYCSVGYWYYNIDWAKMQSITILTDASSNSPVKYLSISFTPNSILRTGYIREGCVLEGFKRFGEKQSVNHILFPYRDEEGVKERLIKALNHLSKLAKEEKAKNDPFGN